MTISKLLYAEFAIGWVLTAICWCVGVFIDFGFHSKGFPDFFQIQAVVMAATLLVMIFTGVVYCIVKRKLPFYD